MSRWTVAAVVLSVVPTFHLSAQEPFPTEPPPAAALRPVQFPPFREVALPNGMTLVVIEHHEQPTLSVSLSFRAGAAFDPAGKEGLASMVAELITKGTPTRGAEQIAAEIEGVGGSLSASAGEDFFTVSTDALSDYAELVFALLGDVARRATYPAEELELARTRFLSALDVELSQPDAVAERFFEKEVYGRHPYGRSPTAESYRAITREDVAAFAGARLRPGGALLVVSGDITLARARALAMTAFGSWRGTAPAAAAAPALPVKRATDILLVHRPGSVQANIVLGNTTFLPTDTGYYSARLATQVLGGGPDARLFLILREQKSWTYGSYAALRRNRGMGHWEATFEGRTAVVDSALTELLRQVGRIRTELIPAAELNAAKGFLVGSFPLTIETPRQIAQVVTTARLLGLGPTYLQRYRERLSAVTAGRARAAARRIYRRDALTIVVVGDALELYEKLRAIAPVRVVDIAGKPVDMAALRPQEGPIAWDRAQLVARRDSFQAVLQGNPFGTQSSALELAGDSLIYTESTALGPIVQQQTTVILEASDLSMRRVRQTGTVQSQRSEIALTYGGGRVKGNATVPQGGGTPQEVSVDTSVAPGTIDDNALNILLPALPLAEGKSFRLNVFSSGQGTSKVLTVTVAGTETLTVPAGTFTAYRLELAGMQLPVVMHVGTETPRRILRIAPTGAPIVFQLVK